MTFTPGVVEPSFGIDRILFSVLEHSYYARPKDFDFWQGDAGGVKFLLALQMCSPHGLYIWGPIANASLRIMNGYVDFYIRDCKTLHRDRSAIGLRLMQSCTVYMGENHII